MKFRKITKEDAENLKRGDIVFIYPNRSGLKDIFDINDTDTITPLMVESNEFGNVQLSFNVPKEGVPVGLFWTATMGNISKHVNELPEQGRYWIQEVEED